MTGSQELLRCIPEVRAEDYFRELRSMFHIGNIYYPGCGADRELEKFFGEDEIVYLDNDLLLWKRSVHGNGNKHPKFVRGDYDNPPFQDEFFDAVFMQDLHANKEELENILKSLRPEGLLIFSANDCEFDIGSSLDNEDLDVVRQNSLLREVELPVRHDYLITFRKIQPLPTQGQN